MAEVTVEQLATTVGTGPDKLLSQMKDAGLPHKKADEVVSDDDKRTLLAHLKRSHGSAEEAPRKITLKRKSLSTLKAGGSSGKRTVNVEVRKKRTYVKRPEAEEVSDAESAETGTSADEVVELTSAPELVADVESTEVAAESVEIEAPQEATDPAEEAAIESSAEPELVE